MTSLRHECQPNSHGLCDVRHVDAGGRRRHCWGATTRTGVVFLQALLSINPLWVQKSVSRRRRSKGSTCTCTNLLDTQLEKHGCEVSRQSLTLRRSMAVMSREARFCGRTKHSRASVLERFPLTSSLSGAWSYTNKSQGHDCKYSESFAETFNVQGTDVPWHGARVYNSESFR